MDFSEPIDKYDQLQELFHKDLREKIFYLEKLRKRAVFEGTISGLKLIALSPISIIFNLDLSSLTDKAKELHKEYINSYRNTIIPAVLNLIEPSLSYNHYSGLTQYSYAKSGLYDGLNRYFFSDLIKGKDEGAEFKICIVNSGYTNFFMQAEPRKNFQARTYINPQDKEVLKIVRPVILEDQEFNKRFKVYSSNQQEARYLITTNFMQKLMQISNSIGKDNYLAASFVSNSFYMSMSCPEKDIFSPSIDEKATSFDNVRDIFIGLVKILRIIDSLELGNRIWSKR